MSRPTPLNPPLPYTTRRHDAGLAVTERRVNDPRATVVFVHGALDRGSSFARLSRQLDAFDVVAYDRRGYQGSRDLSPVDLDHHTLDLLDVVDREPAGRAIVLCGHSFGGLVTWGAALRDPSRINLVVNYETPFPWLVPRDNPQRAPRDEPPLEAERFFRRVVSNDAWERLSEVQRESRRQDGPALIADLRVVRADTAPYDLKDLRTRSTYLYGDDTHSRYYQRLAAVLAATYPTMTTAESIHSGHAAHLKNPQALAALIVEQWESACASA